MVVTQTFPITRRPYAGLGVPGMPIGLWAVHSGVLGDGSGGTIHNILLFSGSTFQAANSLLYSLDQIYISSILAQDTQEGLMEVLGFDLLPQNGGTGGQFTWNRFVLAGVGQPRLGQALIGTSLPLPIFLGQPIKGAQSRLLFEWENVVGDSLSVKAGGYYWEAGAINAAGGPQRPAQGLFQAVR